MRKIPQSVRDLIKRVCEQYPTDSEAAANAAEKRLKRLKDYPIYAEIMARRAIRDSVYDEWHYDNRKMKKKIGDHPGKKAEVVIGKSKVVQKVAAEVWKFHIAGTLLGRVVCSELPEIGDRELKIAAGFSLKGNLCHRLYKMVPKSKRELMVSQVISEKRIRKVFEELKKNDA